jgi:hypothetical protein
MVVLDVCAALFVSVVVPEDRAAGGADTARAAGLADRASTDGEVLQSLHRYDTIFRSGFSASAEQRRTQPIDLRGPSLRQTAHWRLTFEGERAGYVMEVTDYETPGYLPPGARAWAADPDAGNMTRAESMFVSMRMSDWGYWGGQASGDHHVDATLEILPDGRARKVGAIYDTSLYSPQDLSPIAALRAFQWGCGRFFSDRLVKITQIEQSADGLLRVLALGNRYEGDDGTWELEIEPDAAWMVRRAAFRPQANPDRIKAQMANKGTHWSGPFCVPAEASVNFFGPIEDLDAVPATRTQTLVFDPNVKGFDEQLYQLCQSEVLHGDEPQLTVTDYRVAPPTIRKPNRESARQSAVAQSVAGQSWSWRWVVIANVVAVAVLAAACLLRNRRVARSHEV